jgi:hypothetical protein
MFLQMSSHDPRRTQYDSTEPPGPIRAFGSPLLATCKRLALEPIA